MSDYIERFTHRVIQDALTEALPIYWRRRADQFRDALPREGDYLGQSTRRERRARRKEVEALIEECERRATAREALGPEWWIETLGDRR